jgi:RHS repeat-associated protein
LKSNLPAPNLDKETNTHYNYFRDYDPAIGRYVQSDPIGLGGGINTYAYVNDNPLSYADPRGLDNPGMGPYSPSDPCPCQTGPRWPDFYSVNVNVAIPTPWTATLLGVTGAWTIDRSGTMYWGAGPNVGKAATAASASAAAGWLNQSCKPTTAQLNDFLTGSALNVGAGYWGGAAFTYSPSTGGTATSVGVFTPQAGGGYTYSWQGK